MSAWLKGELCLKSCSIGCDPSSSDGGMLLSASAITESTSIETTRCHYNLGLKQNSSGSYEE